MLRYLMIGSLALVLAVGFTVSDATAGDYIDPCAGYAGYDDADRAFLAGGGPDVDAALLDLDGDGYPCEELIGAPFEAVDAEIGVYPRGGNAGAGLPRPDEQLNDTPVDSPSSSEGPSASPESSPSNESSASTDASPSDQPSPSTESSASTDASSSAQPSPTDEPSAPPEPSRSDEPSALEGSSETLTFALRPSDTTDDARPSGSASAPASASASDTASAVASPSASPVPSAPADDDPELSGVLAPDAISIAASTLVDQANAGTFAFFGETGAGEGMGLDGYTPLAGLTLTVRDQATGAVIDRGTSDADGLILLDGQTGAPFSLEIDGASSVSRPYQLADGQRMGLWLASYIAAPAPPVAEAPPVVAVPQPVTVTLDPPVTVAEPRTATVDFSPAVRTTLILPTAGTGPTDGSGAVPALPALLAALAALAAATVALVAVSRPGSPAPTAVRTDPSIRNPGR